MSCDGNTAAHAANIAASPQIAAALGGGDAAAAKQAILDIHELAATRAERMLRARGQLQGMARVQARAADAAATEATVAAFGEIRAARLAVPAHGDDDPRYGFPLPKMPAQYGWKAVQDTLTAIRERRTMPALAQEVLMAAQTTRRMTSIVEAGKGRYRCAECGRYRRPGDHTCPMTATAQALGAKLTRKLGVPVSAYPAAALDALIAQARQGDVLMRHGMTGEEARVSLDGLPGALAGGFIPDAWRQAQTLVLAQLADGRVVPVLDKADVTVLPRQATALGQVAAAYGAAIPPGAAFGSAVAVPLRRVQHVQQAATTGVSGGQVYDVGHFIGSEFRKGGSHGAPIRVGAVTYAVGQRSKDPAHFGSARDLSGNTTKTDLASGKEPLPKGGSVAVGRTLMEAAGILHDGEVVETADGQIQIYSKDRRSLLAVYDPATNTAGDTAGATNMSAPQMAAVMAWRALHPQNAFDVALANDLVAMSSGAGNAWRASDAMYIAAKNGVFASGNQLSFGGQVATQKCPTCGRFAGDAHNCPGPAQQAAPAQPRGGGVVVEDLPAGLPTAGAPTVGATTVEPGGARSVEQSPSVILRPPAVFAPAANTLVASPAGDMLVAFANNTSMGMSGTQIQETLDAAAAAILADSASPDALRAAARAWQQSAGMLPGTFAQAIVMAAGAQRCGDCGQFMSLQTPHACPKGPAVAAPVMAPVAAPLDHEALRATIAEALAAMPPATLSPHVNVDVTLDEGKLAGALAGALAQAQPTTQPGVVQLDEEKLAAALRAGMPQQMAGAAQFDAEALANAIKAGVPQSMAVELDEEKLAAALQKGMAAQQAPHVTLQLDTAALADALKAMPAPVMDTSAFTAALQATLASVAAGNAHAVAPVAQAGPDGAPAVVAAADPAVAQAMQQIAQAAQRMTEVAERLAQGGAAATQSTAPTAAGPPEAPVGRQPRTGLIRPEGMPLTAQEHILSNIRLPAPDPYMMDVPIAVGGQRGEPLNEYIPDLDPNYEIGETNERILRAMSAAIQAGQRGDARRSFWSRAFGLYGPAGTGKNTLMRQLAASIQTVDRDGSVTQGLPYTEYNVLPDSTLEDALGTVTLESDGRGGTRSVVKLGKIGLALAMGSVVCINEIARNEKLATALQSALEDGEIIIGSPEAGMQRIPVHPASIIGLTWNPGNEGDPDRPAAAPLSRIMPFELPKATARERQQRLGGFLKQFQPAGSAPAVSDAQRDAEREQIRQTILRKDYKIPDDLTVSDAELTAAVNFVQDVEGLAGTGAMDRKIGLNSRTPTRPGDRQLRNFVVLGKTVGWKEAVNTFRICCDQNDQFDEQWRLIQERFEAHFGPDGNAPSRRAANTGPQRT